MSIGQLFKSISDPSVAFLNTQLGKMGDSRRWLLVNYLLGIFVLLNVVLFAMAKILDKAVASAILPTYVSLVMGPFVGVLGIAIGYFYHSRMKETTGPNGTPLTPVTVADPNKIEGGA